MNNIDFVSVVNNFEIYDNLFNKNEFVNKHNLIHYNNMEENLPIPVRYNDYIQNKMETGSWVVFCHQDFEFHEDIAPKLESLDKNSIYGPIGSSWKKNLVFFLRLEGIKIRKFRLKIIKKQTLRGQIFEDWDNEKVLVGNKAKNLEIVDTLDCCCFIAHSNLIDKMNFRFDENLKWHFYSENFSLTAKLNHQIDTKILNFNASHFSRGTYDISFYYHKDYLMKKFGDFPFSSTVYDGYYSKFLKTL